ncbi:spore coat assembly protein [Priestia taiwanensis]|uniref:Sporulation peptidase YabG n=2 Tax=Priestia taiwanensis TaxID=1347902 RepID=A0A917AZ91_9BACI|nr:sporulation peptidase YabG [Priestia taiwanensis]MBM7365187.1 spore coat assembly protein [Priestia taiwanensis]GGE84572.1 sporulation peptidase YabG [Priestia taiwanensis]
MMVRVGDLVGRTSHGCDLLFRVIEIKEENGQKTAILYGEDVRLIADAPIHDLVLVDEGEYSKRAKREREKVEKTFRLFKQDYQLIKQRNEYYSTRGYSNDIHYFQLPGKVLHIDGDPLYLRKCLELYEKMNVPVQGVYCKETEMHQKVGQLIDEYRPDILVITGHDAYTKAKGKVTDLKAYRHSRYFVETVREARKKIPSLDQLIIFAGACQSHFEALIHAGANFASSPSRINIHALDPVYVVAKISYTPFMDRVQVWDIVKNTITGEKGLGGIETRGILRTGMPFQLYEEKSQG